MKLVSTPIQDGYRMPGEYEPHQGCLMIWPSRPGSWPYGAVAARKAFKAVAEAISKSEKVYMLVGPAGLESARSMLPERVQILEMESDDAWARDVGPTFVVNPSGDVRGVDWQFNAWGGTYDGLYPHWEKDDQVAAAFCARLSLPCYEARPFVLEGGAIHSDGEGTLMVTKACLLSPGRNPKMTQAQIEGKLKAYTGAKKVLWLPHGIYGDETNEHVDNMCAFVRPGEVVLAWTEDETDPQYAYCQATLQYLEAAVDARGRRLVIHRLPIPASPLLVTQEDVLGFVFEEGEDRREPGERLAGSYVNFYISNGHVIVPQFGDVHDKKAVEILAGLFPEREITGILARDILVGGGNIHCITQQIPKGGKG